jgi:hypothetical protein
MANARTRKSLKRNRAVPKPRSMRVAFMFNNPQLWDSEPKYVVNALKDAGLLAQSTYWQDAAKSIPQLIADAKRLKPPSLSELEKYSDFANLTPYLKDCAEQSVALTTQEFVNSPRGQQVRQWALADAADQVSAVKQELYRLRDYILRIPHEEQRDMSLKHFETAYNAFDKLQDFMRSR